MTATPAPLPGEPHDSCAALTAAHLYRRIDALLNDWKDSGVHLSCDAEMAALAQARDLERPGPDLHDFGRRIWEAYCERRPVLFEILRDADDAKRRQMAEAMDSYLMARFGRSGGVELFLKDWEDLAKRSAA